MWFLYIWGGLVLLAVVGCCIYAGYQGDVDYQTQQDMENCALLVVFLPVVLFVLVSAMPFFLLNGIGKLLRLAVEARGRSKKNRA